MEEDKFWRWLVLCLAESIDIADLWFGGYTRGDWNFVTPKVALEMIWTERLKQENATIVVNVILPWYPMGTIPLLKWKYTCGVNPYTEVKHPSPPAEGWYAALMKGSEYGRDIVEKWVPEFEQPVRGSRLVCEGLLGGPKEWGRLQPIFQAWAKLPGPGGSEVQKRTERALRAITFDPEAPASWDKCSWVFLPTIIKQEYAAIHHKQVKIDMAAKKSACELIVERSSATQ